MASKIPSRWPQQGGDSFVLSVFFCLVVAPIVIDSLSLF